MSFPLIDQWICPGEQAAVLLGVAISCSPTYIDVAVNSGGYNVGSIQIVTVAVRYVVEHDNNLSESSCLKFRLSKV